MDVFLVQLISGQRAIDLCWLSVYSNAALSHVKCFTVARDCNSGMSRKLILDLVETQPKFLSARQCDVRI